MIINNPGSAELVEVRVSVESRPSTGAGLTEPLL
ncbi:hypothetical protein MNBD_ALPHA04-2173 [hydrothermal vent metagenome]|uniref:Uncharacterized protein n=1 Tax=hydrothermal vent metagenome TaxID=652676 RepID=A0A3B0SRN5_9ZZZZ